MARIPVTKTPKVYVGGQFIRSESGRVFGLREGGRGKGEAGSGKRDGGRGTGDGGRAITRLNLLMEYFI